jgi:hypothetical protein
MKFINKEEYLTWRSQWRADYRALSKQIRDIKFARWSEDSRRGGVKMSEVQLARYNQIAQPYIAKHGVFYPSYQLEALRAKATAMLEERKLSKQEAQRQYCASRKDSQPLPV